MGWYITLGIIGLFVLVTLLRAAFYKPKKQDFGALSEEKVDGERAIRRLSEAIQIPTISYPDESKMDWEKFREFHAFLERSYPLVHSKLSRENISAASLLYRWKGKDSSLDAIALLSHQDVVPVTSGTEGDWTHPPFSGHVGEGFIWGRGAIDMKNHLICTMEAVETLLEQGFEPERDVYICFGHDEEVVGGEVSGAKDIVQALKERGVHLDCVLDEGGPFLPLKLKGLIDKNIIAVGISEKGYADYEISIAAKGGHSSTPPNHSALGELAVAIQELENHQFRAKMLPYLSELLGNIGRSTTYPARLLFCNMWLLKPLIKLIMKRIPAAASLVRTTTAVTMAQGSPACNVLPQKAVANVNFRMMPGTSLADVKAHIRKVVSNKKLEITYIKGKEASPFSPTDSRAYLAIEQLCKQQEPNSVMAPFLVMGGTDSAFYEPICSNIYRFSPFRITPNLLTAAHATDERVPVESVGNAVAFFIRYIRALSQK